MNKHNLIFSFLSVALLFLGACEVGGVKTNKEVEPAKTDVSDEKKEGDFVLETDADTTIRSTKTLLSGVKIVWTKKNDSLPRLKSGDVIRIKHVGRLKDGKVFDSWKQLGIAPSICLGYKMAVEGWEQGLFEMAEGEKAKISVPAKLGYPEGYGELIPPNSELIYEVEVVENIQASVLNSGVKLFVIERDDQSKEPALVKGQELTFGYMTFAKGKGLYDNSYKNGKPFSYKYGSMEVVPGLNVAMSKIRGKDKVYVQVPAEMAYGKKGLLDLVPSNTDILYDIMMMESK